MVATRQHPNLADSALMILCRQATKSAPLLRGWRGRLKKSRHSCNQRLTVYASICLFTCLLSYLVVNKISKYMHTTWSCSQVSSPGQKACCKLQHPHPCQWGPCVSMQDKAIILQRWHSTQGAINKKSARHLPDMPRHLPWVRGELYFPHTFQLEDGSH